MEVQRSDRRRRSEVTITGVIMRRSDVALIYILKHFRCYTSLTRLGVVSSIVSGAFIMTDGNFGLIFSKGLHNPGDPYFGWISKIGGGEKKMQM